MPRTPEKKSDYQRQASRQNFENFSQAFRLGRLQQHQRGRYNQGGEVLARPLLPLFPRQRRRLCCPHATKSQT